MSIFTAAPECDARAGAIVLTADCEPSNEAGLSGLPTLQPRTGRGVLDGALAVLDALAAADDGPGLRALVRATGLAKASAYRLAEQLVSLGAAQRLGRRYYVGERIGRIGRRWDAHQRELSNETDIRASRKPAFER
jgi:hypothetical protein